MQVKLKISFKIARIFRRVHEYEMISERYKSNNSNFQTTTYLPYDVENSCSQPIKIKSKYTYLYLKPHPHEQFLCDNFSVANVFARVHGTRNDMFNRCH